MDFLEDDPTRAWRLRSNSGRELWIVHGSVDDHGGGPAYRSAVFGTDVFTEQHAFGGDLDGLAVDTTAVEELCGRLGAYLVDPNPFDVTLAEPPGPALRFELGPRSDVISSLDEPVARIWMEASRITVDASFVVDQSCLRLLLDDLDGWLSRQ